MRQIKVQCPAKINLTLKIIGKREDGFHNIESIMQTINLYDYLTISIENSEKLRIEISGTSDKIPYDKTNLVLSETIKSELNDVNRDLKESLTLKLDDYVTRFNNLFTNLLESNKKQVEIINTSVSSLNTVLDDVLMKQNQDISSRLSNVTDTFKTVLSENFEISSEPFDEKISYHIYQSLKHFHHYIKFRRIYCQPDE